METKQRFGRMFYLEERTENATSELGLRPSARPWYAKSRDAVSFSSQVICENDWLYDTFVI